VCCPVCTSRTGRILALREAAVCNTTGRLTFASCGLTTQNGSGWNATMAWWRSTVKPRVGVCSSSSGSNNNNKSCGMPVAFCCKGLGLACICDTTTRSQRPQQSQSKQVQAATLWPGAMWQHNKLLVCGTRCRRHALGNHVPYLAGPIRHHSGIQVAVPASARLMVSHEQQHMHASGHG
jgi:hypothetical protein